ncbi:MAG: BrnA antitoxin family protein [Candidatus Methylomirabilis sp.]|nr:BrnA antitoxin family protein [Candidatus Methylomirabilis sp.]
MQATSEEPSASNYSPPEVVAYFRSTGEGWQARMDRVLRQYAARRTRAA